LRELPEIQKKYFEKNIKKFAQTVLSQYWPVLWLGLAGQVGFQFAAKL
jgi:hypothetical protein